MSPVRDVHDSFFTAANNCEKRAVLQGETYAIQLNMFLAEDSALTFLKIRTQTQLYRQEIFAYITVSLGRWREQLHELL